MMWAEHGWCMHPDTAVELIAHTGQEGGSIPPLSRQIRHRIKPETGKPIGKPAMTRSCFTKERFAPKGRISALESASPWKTPPASHLLGLPVGKTGGVGL